MHYVFSYPLEVVTLVLKSRIYNWQIWPLNTNVVTCEQILKKESVSNL